jgi:hypothetical protein
MLRWLVLAGVVELTQKSFANALKRYQDMEKVTLRTNWRIELLGARLFFVALLLARQARN